MGGRIRRFRVGPLIPTEGSAMSRSARTRIPVEDKLRIVLSVLRGGEMSVSEAARRRGVSAVAVS
ncbi:hypothetical protein CEQ30_16620 [Nocardia brasiliensis]|nr:hypothetical protein CEQ30_16620 [Nocardia brasiliensis]